MISLLLGFIFFVQDRLYDMQQFTVKNLEMNMDL